MPLPARTLRHFLRACACLAPLGAEELASDGRWRIHCERPCRIELGPAVKGCIGLKVSPYAHNYITRLDTPGIRYDLQANHNYYLDLIEAPREGSFQFEVRLTPAGRETAQVFELRSVAEAPFIRITPKPAGKEAAEPAVAGAQEPAAGTPAPAGGGDAGPSTITIGTDPKEPLIDIK
jgi:hypothetical protein